MNNWIIAEWSLFIIAIVAYATQLRRKLDFIKFIFFYLILTLFVLDVPIYLFHIPKRQRSLLYCLYVGAEYTILSLLYWTVFRSSRVKKWIVISIPFFLSCILLSLFVAKMKFNDSYNVLIYPEAGLEQVLLSAWSLLFLREIILLQEIESLLSFPMFWVSAAILDLFIGGLFVGSLNQYLSKHYRPLASKFSVLYNVFDILFFCLLIVSLLCHRIFNRVHTALQENETHD